jgi:hypothetical protein
MHVFNQSNYGSKKNELLKDCLKLNGTRKSRKKIDLMKKVANKLNIVYEGLVESSSSSTTTNWKS